MGLGPTGFVKPVPIPLKSCTHGCGYGFWWVQVLVAQKNPRVARDNPYKGLYEHPIIQKAVNKMWFMKKCDEGIVLKDYFNLIQIPSIALILTAVSSFFCLSV